MEAPTKMQMQGAKRRPDTIRQRNASEVSLIDALSYLLSIVKRQHRVIILATLITSALGVAYVTLTPRSYTAKALLVSDVKRLQLSQAFGEAPIDPAVAETQVEILKSEKVLLPVIKNLNLTENPEFNHTGRLSRLFGSSNAISQDIREQRLLETLKNALSVMRIGRTQLVEIGVKARDPDLAARLVNAIAESFILDQAEAKAEAARRASTWLQERVRELGEQASKAERAVVEFKIANNIVDAGGRLMNDQQIGELNIKLVSARSDVSQASAKLSRIETILAKAHRNSTADATVADTLSSPVVTKLRDRYLELATRVADYAARFGPNHMSVIRINSQMQEIRNSIDNELQRLAETYKSDLEIAKQKEEEIQKALKETIAKSQATSQAQVKLRELESSAHSYRVLHDSFLQRHTEQVQQESMRLSDARLISPAAPPLRPSHPRIFLSLALAAFGGTVLGMGAAAFREMWDRVFRTSEQVEKLLSKNCISLTPRLATSEPRQSQIEEANARLAKDGGSSASNREDEAPKGGKKSGSSPGETPSATKTSCKIISNSEGPAAAIVHSSFSRFAEAIQSIKLAADLLLPENSSKVIGLTSALPNEGKSTIAANFARLIARTGARTVLVDCDLRMSGVTKMLAPDANAGITEVIAGQSSLDETMWNDELTAMKFLPCRTGSKHVHPAEILGSDSARKVFRSLRESYEWVIVDLAPLGPVIDTQSTAGLLDSYVLVVEWGQTKCTIVSRALESAKDVNERLLGVVLNKVDLAQLQNYDSHFMSYDDEYFTGQEEAGEPLSGRRLSPLVAQDIEHEGNWRKPDRSVVMSGDGACQ
jgi:succinoglycan biosynthesis transport protein ExoP